MSQKGTHTWAIMIAVWPPAGSVSELALAWVLLPFNILTEHENASVLLGSILFHGICLWLFVFSSIYFHKDLHISEYKSSYTWLNIFPSILILDSRKWDRSLKDTT